MRQLCENLQDQNLPVRQPPIACDPQRRWIELLESIASGDRSALGSLYDHTSPVVFGLLVRILADRAIAEEVLLDVFKQVWRQAAHYDARRCEPLAWLLTIARARALAYRRSHNSETEIQSLQIQTTHPSAPEPESVISQQQKRARAALLSLSARQRQVIELAYFDGLSQKEIAAKLGLPVDVISNHLRLGMMELRDFLRANLQEQR